MTDLQPLDARARLLFYLQAISRLVLVWLPASVVLGGVLLASFGIMIGLGVGAGVFFLMFLVAVWYPTLAFDRWGYAVDDEEMLISRGVVIRRVTAIPLHRVQHVDTRQGVLEQWLGLARVQVFTASGIGGDGVVPGLALEVAEALRDKLVAMSGGDDGV